MANVQVLPPIEPADCSITIVKGLTFEPLIFNFYDGGGRAFNLSGYLVYAEIRAAPEDPLIFDFSPAVTDAPGGVVTIPGIDFSTTFLLPVGVYQWDLLMDDGSGDRQSYVAGSVTIADKVTKST